jgi:putative FmdB family regulatory protein
MVGGEVIVPLYEYQCGQCGRFEIIQKFSDAPLSVCPTCSEPVQKLLSAPAIQFKGTGWYITDYARKSDGGNGTSKDKKESKPSEGKDSGGNGSTSKGGSGSGSSPSSS